MSDAAIFLDKDGTLLVNVPYNVDPRAMRLAPGATEALEIFAELDAPLFVISNQSGVAHGRFDISSLDAVELRLRQLVACAGATLAGVYWCPHHPIGRVAPYNRACDCRKPAPGMLLRTAREHDVALERSWFVGDILDDVEAGRRAGCRTVLIDNGNETVWQRGPMREPHAVAADLRQAAHVIKEAMLASSRRREVVR
ncbi:D-glycero-alpha-D-manno-heptose-1,7-bisphosphate 7-phosphatase [Caballeronia glathei]|jgi:histidinol-phosphate phosphatase family protein|uniref:D,D-heptose 1,7-bisphosphate phosphatase n=1 Tax=Caballeronia glathei TaxID=60547 RepID=A0A069PER5_9BURK|nr:HAD-IIIA family hydrolase [Caballeronia glathei]KDR38324.1 HAD family hydrolase [Caballeronia glathei]